MGPATCANLIKIFLYFLIAVVVLSSTKDRIIGGQKVENRSDFAYQVLIIANVLYGKAICGGTIIDEKHILTAAHCLIGSRASETTVVAGNLDFNDRHLTEKVSDMFIHENYSSVTTDNDIGVLRIAGTFEYSLEVRPIVLRTNRLEEGLCNVSGWGVVNPDEPNQVSLNLKYAEIPIVERNKCEKLYFGSFNNYELCAGTQGTDACMGDSGGPLVCHGKLTGIVSYGMADCDADGFPAVYTEVASYINWIDEQKLKPSKVDRLLISKSAMIIAMIAITKF